MGRRAGTAFGERSSTGRGAQGRRRAQAAPTSDRVSTPPVRAHRGAIISAVLPAPFDSTPALQRRPAAPGSAAGRVGRACLERDEVLSRCRAAPQSRRAAVAHPKHRRQLGRQPEGAPLQLGAELSKSKEMKHQLKGSVPASAVPCTKPVTTTRPRCPSWYRTGSRKLQAGRRAPNRKRL